MIIIFTITSIVVMSAIIASIVIVNLVIITELLYCCCSCYCSSGRFGGSLRPSDCGLRQELPSFGGSGARGVGAKTT